MIEGTSMHPINLSSAFRLVFSTVVFLTLLSGGVFVWLSSQKDLSPHQLRVFETSSATYQMGAGAIFGLLGGKVTDLFEDEED
jgi:hypothetical protein